MPIPKWAAEPFDAFIEYQKRLHNFYYLCLESIDEIVYRAKQVEDLTTEIEALEAQDEYLAPDSPGEKLQRAKNVEDHRERAERAKREVDFDFPTLHEQQAISMWTGLECLVEDFLTALLANESSAMQLEEVTKIKISVSEYTTMSGDERCRYLLAELERSINRPIRHGSEKFEALLNIFGLSGEVAVEVRKNLLELEMVRNVLLHRRGIVDSRFRQICPWHNAEVGTKITLNREMFARYMEAGLDYARNLRLRVRKRFDDNLGPTI